MPANQYRRIIGVAAVLIMSMMAGTSHYTVNSGETLSEIAYAHGVSVSDLAAANDIADADFIYVGQQLAIPGQSSVGGTSAPASITHVVSAGETLGSIAARYGTTTSTIMALNGITNPSLIYTGTQLMVSGAEPTGTLPSVGSGATGTHTVAAGETLSEIAAAYGVSVADIVAANGLSDPDRIVAGQKIQLDGSGGGFVCPVAGSRFFNDWGFPRSGDRFHQGNDLFAPRSTPVRAPVSGYVHHLVGSVGGNQFRLDGNDGNRYIGSHMEAFGLSGNVVAGDVIGFVGDSGNAIGSDPHLHFEIHLNRTDPVNPYPVLEQACR